MTVLINNTVSGVYAIAPTPFRTDRSIDLLSIDGLVDYYGHAGADGLTILGQLGEAAKLDSDEAKAVADRFLARAEVPVIVGVSAPGFATMRSLTCHVMDRGAAGVMVAPPHTLRTDEQIIRYYNQVVENLGDDVPIVIQDYPLTFDVVMSTSVISAIATAHPSCVMLKHEDWPGLEKISSLRNLCESGDMPRLSILCGNGGLFLDFEVQRGADGAMTGYCFTEALVAIVAAFARGDNETGHSIFDAHLPLIRYEQQPGAGLGVRKYVLAKRKIIANDAQRTPGSVLTPTAIAEVEGILRRLADHPSSMISI